MKTTLDIMKSAKIAAPSLLLADSKTKNTALEYMADALCDNEAEILSANELDLESARGTISDVMLDRLALDHGRILSMADGVRQVAQLPDPVGRVIERVSRPNGMVIEKTAVPLGVIAIIYESRPNVTSDAAALAVKSGNACILRCGKEAHRSAFAIVDALKEGLSKAGLSPDLVQLTEDITRQSASDLMNGVGYIDLLIPRGGASLIKACTDTAKVPCIQTGTGICHIFVDESADFDAALNIIENAKTSRPSVCNAAEVCLVHKNIADKFLPLLKARLTSHQEEIGKHPVKLITDPKAFEIIGGTAASDSDFDTEFLDYVMAIGVVDSADAAIAHIAKHSTGHSESIITQNENNANAFVMGVDSAAVYVNVSTRFTDGGEFGLGCEMGISTQKLHARGPMGLCELTTYKYIVRGNGQIR